jgi:hypothetical protein
MSAIKQLVESFLNGNLANARQKAKRFTNTALTETLEHFGHSPNKAYLGACYLKNGSNWQFYCDAK